MAEAAEAKGGDATEATHHKPHDVHDEDAEGTKDTCNYVDMYFNHIKAFEPVNLEYNNPTHKKSAINVISEPIEVANTNAHDTKTKSDTKKDISTHIEPSNRDILINNLDFKKGINDSDDNNKESNYDKNKTVGHSSTNNNRENALKTTDNSSKDTKLKKNVNNSGIKGNKQILVPSALKNGKKEGTLILKNNENKIEVEAIIKQVTNNMYHQRASPQFIHEINSRSPMVNELLKRAISNAFRHDLNLRPGHLDSADGNCLWESLLYKILYRPLTYLKYAR